MRVSRTLLRVLGVLCFCYVLCGQRIAIADEIIDRVLAVVAGDVIMLSDVTAAKDLGLVPPGAGADPVREILSRLIDRALILDEVERYAPPDPSADAIASDLQRVRAKFPGARDFDEALARVGLDEARLRETLRQNLRISAYLDQRFSADSPGRRETLIKEWTAGLRRRADIIDLYLATP